MRNTTQRKILSFSTTMRNPSRMGHFLTILEKFENKTLNHDTIIQIIKLVLNFRLYRPNIINANLELKQQFDSNEYIFSDNELERIIELAPQNHKEKGYDKGWESRFDTWYKLMSEFGFCYYAKNKKILISKSAKMLISAYYDRHTWEFKDDVDDSIVGAVFLNVLAKYEVGNPYKKNLNHTIPFRLLLQLLVKLKLSNESPLHIKEIPILLCWHNNDVNKLYEYINKIRQEIYAISHITQGYSDEFIYEKCLTLLDSDNKKRFKMNQIMNEAVDEYIRKMRITGLISLRGNGRYIDFNTNENEKIEYIINLKTYFKCNYLDDSDINKFEYYKYMANIDINLINISYSYTNDDIKIKKLKELACLYNKSDIKNELLITCNKKASTDNLLKLIDRPLRLEFLIAIFLVQHFADLFVLPNYKSDDEGLPIFTASGGKADIIAYDTVCESYIEVSLIKDRKQTTLEMIPIARHLQEYIKSSINNKTKFSIFVAPNIHPDSIDYAKYSKHKKHINIPYYAINDFINKVETSKELLNLNDETLLV